MCLQAKSTTGLERGACDEQFRALKRCFLQAVSPLDTEYLLERLRKRMQHSCKHKQYVLRGSGCISSLQAGYHRPTTWGSKRTSNSQVFMFKRGGLVPPLCTMLVVLKWRRLSQYCSEDATTHALVRCDTATCWMVREALEQHMAAAAAAAACIPLRSFSTEIGSPLFSKVQVPPQLSPVSDDGVVHHGCPWVALGRGWGG